jgi:hypothetical protein
MYILSSRYAEIIKIKKIKNDNKISFKITFEEVLVFVAMVTQASFIIPIIQSFFK